MNTKKTIIFGASGLVGSHLLRELLNNPDYEQITVVVRRPIEAVHPKLTVLTGDFHSLPQLKNQIVADDVFIAVGFSDYQAEHDYVVTAAKMAKENGAKAIFAVTAVQANVNSKNKFIRTKGEIERDLAALNFDHTAFFRVSMLTGRAKKPLPEKIMTAVWTVIDPFLLSERLKRYKGISGKDVATAMNKAASKQQGKVNIYYWQEMKSI